LKSSAVRQVYKLLSKKEKLLLAVATSLRIFGSILEIAGLAIVGVVVSLISGSDISRESISGFFVFRILNNIDANPIVVASLLSLAFFLFKAFLMILVNFWVAHRLAKLEVNQTIRAFRNVQNSTLEEIERFTHRQIAHGLNGSASVAFNTTLNSLSNLMGELFLLISVIAYMFIVDWASTLALIGFFLAALLGLQIFLGRKLSYLARVSDDASVSTNALTLDFMENFRQARSPDVRLGFTEAFLATRTKLAQARALSSTMSLLPRYSAEIALATGVALLIIFQIQFLGSFDPAGVSILIVGSFRLIGSVVSSQSYFNTLLQFQEQSKWALNLVSLIPEDSILGMFLSRPSRPPSVKAKNLGYKYEEGSHVLEGLNFEVMPNELLLVRGKSGVGKSTLADLILGLRNPTAGSLSISGLSSREYQSRYPGAIAYVPQRTSLIEGSLLENIVFSPTSDLGCDLNRLESAISLSGLTNLLNQLEHGVQTKIGVGYHGLSGGQIQRVGLARALYRNPSLIVLDEVTSSLDTQTSQEITATLNQLTKYATVIIISHKPEQDLAFDKELEIR
jgi:ABC-type multidrug transport system fused ATPase/permease subunit